MLGLLCDQVRNLRKKLLESGHDRGRSEGGVFPAVSPTAAQDSCVGRTARGRSRGARGRRSREFKSISETGQEYMQRT